MKKVTLATAVIAVFSALVFLACNKEKGSYKLDVHMTDAPAAFEEVNVDIQEVKVKLRNDTTAWVSLSTNAGVYNLLGLQNGVDTLLASGTLSSNFVQEVRLFLGTNNSIKVAGQTFPLVMDNGTQTKLMIKANKELNATLNSLLIDFDANLSVVLEGNGTYRLSPVITLKN
jgi:Domain of unknown function (DUF4382)